MEIINYFFLFLFFFYTDMILSLKSLFIVKYGALRVNRPIIGREMRQDQINSRYLPRHIKIESVALAYFFLFQV